MLQPLVTEPRALTGLAQSPVLRPERNCKTCST